MRENLFFQEKEKVFSRSFQKKAVSFYVRAPRRAGRGTARGAGGFIEGYTSFPRGGRATAFNGGRHELPERNRAKNP